ncbi:telomere-associated helicase [Fusarium mundagurra]|uniref:Telomere-associated helicase n=1 Tax=Fusarium mundagurra TaxID=1567541 RepID=A0A8H5Y9R4_9HYPO|nr:telomere-associated helicase [Fusarium mundagurra]
MNFRNYGRAMAQSDPATFLLRWSDDSETVFYVDILQVTMSDFRRLPRYFINEAESLCEDMMFGWKPTIDLSNLKDDMTNVTRLFVRTASRQPTAGGVSRVVRQSLYNAPPWPLPRWRDVHQIRYD